MLATYKENYPSFFPFKSAVGQVALCLLYTILLYCNGYYSSPKSVDCMLTFIAIMVVILSTTIIINNQ